MQNFCSLGDLEPYHFMRFKLLTFKGFFFARLHRHPLQTTVAKMGLLEIHIYLFSLNCHWDPIYIQRSQTDEQPLTSKVSVSLLPPPRIDDNRFLLPTLMWRIIPAKVYGVRSVQYNLNILELRYFWKHGPNAWFACTLRSSSLINDHLITSKHQARLTDCNVVFRLHLREDTHWHPWCHVRTNGEKTRSRQRQMTRL